MIRSEPGESYRWLLRIMADGKFRTIGFIRRIMGGSEKTVSVLLSRARIDEAVEVEDVQVLSTDGKKAYRFRMVERREAAKGEK